MFVEHGEYFFIKLIRYIKLHFGVSDFSVYGTYVNGCALFGDKL